MNETDIALLRHCAALAARADKIDTAYRVGAIVTAGDGTVLAMGHSRELGPVWHAEAVVIEKARRAGTLDQARTLYSSMEPCSIRQSGRRPCCDVIMRSAIERVVYIAREPETFVQCAGHETLVSAGLVLEAYPALIHLVRAENAHVWPIQNPLQSTQEEKLPTCPHTPKALL